MKKRILSILLLCCMVLTLLPTAAFAAGELPDVKLSVPTTFDKTVDLTKQNGELKIKDSKTYLIKGSTDPNWYFQYRIKIDGKNNTPHIFLDGVRLQAPKDGPAIELYGGASACLYFIGGDSELIGAENFAALQKNKTDGYLRVLVQTGTKLTCEGGRYGAGIGGSKVGIKNFSQGHGMNLHFGSLATGIYGGEILATSGVYGAGIGGGQGGVGEQIYVYSGKLTVRSVSEGAGIGGGQGGPGRFIYIKGGTVNAGSESGGAGIGSGDQDGQNKSEDAHHIEISGGTVEAWSNYAGAGIGGGRGGSGYDISITGGVVRAQGYLGAGIGGGMNGNSGNILIKDTTLTALAFPLYQDYGYTELSASAVGRGSNRAYYMAVMQDQEFAMIIEENIKIGASDGKTVQLSATGWQWRHNQEPYKKYWGTTTELLIPNENGRVDLQRLSLPYAYNYGRVISKLELRCEESTCSHEFGWVNRDGCHIWACVNCGARDPAAEMSKQNAKHIPGDWSNQKQLCTVCGHVLERDTKAPVMETLTDGESYTVEDNIDGNPGAYTFTVSDPAASGETSSGIKSVTINGEPQDGPTYRLPAPDGGNNDAGAEYTVVATDNAGNETTATVRTYRRHHYTVTFDSTGGSEVIEKTMAVTYGEQLGDMPVPRREGYIFLGWYDALVGGKCYGGSDGKSTSPYDKDGDTTLYAQWAEAPSRMVYFNTCGGTMTGPVEVLHKLNTPIAKPSDPTKAGYTFTGWYTDSALTQAWNFDDWVTGELNLYAGWTVNQYTITFDTVGGSEIAPITQDYGTAITTPADPTREGYTFIGWDKAIPTTMPAENMTVTAQWKDSEKPTGEIKINENSWKAFLNNITFGLFFKDTQTVTITAADNSGETVTVEYLLSAKELTKAELDGMTFTAYTAPFCIDPDNEYIIYVRLTDTAGNMDYICSDGIVLDGTSPVITGIENGKTYCEAQTVTITEKYVDTVTVNGTEVTLDENGSFVLSPADGGQKIVVTDKAGNTAEMTVTVNDGHTFGEWTSNGDGTHTRQCTADGCTEGVETDNCIDEDKNHICDICGNIISNHEDANQDHVCDLCGKVISNHEDADNNHVCDHCGKVISNHEDANKDHVCDYCEKVISNHEDADNNHICDYCDKVISNHEDADKDHICDHCGKVISNHEDANKDHVCDLCGKTISNHEDADEDHVCDYCGKVITNHIGGNKTCRDKAVCEACGKSYGELDPNNHTDLKHFPAKAATEDSEGNIEYWYCSGCNKYYRGKDGTKEIAKADTVTAKLPKSPQTGDKSNLMLWFALLFISGGACTALTVKRKYRHGGNAK